MAKTRAIRTVGAKSIEVAVKASTGIAIKARGKPAEIVAYAAAAAVVLMGTAMAAGIYYSVRGVDE